MSKYRKKDQSDIIDYRVKYYIISGILDILMEFKQFGTPSPYFSQVWQRFITTYNNYDVDWGSGLNVPTRIILFDMVWMDLIILNKDPSEILQAGGENDFQLSITENGENAYKDQRFHAISANLYTAKETSKLSRIAIFLAFCSIIITIVLGIINCFGTQNIRVIEVSPQTQSEIKENLR